MLDSSPFVIRHRISDSRSKRLCFQALPETRARFSQWHAGCIAQDRSKKNFWMEIPYGYCRPAKLEAWLDEYSLGEVWEKNVIGGGPH